MYEMGIRVKSADIRVNQLLCREFTPGTLSGLITHTTRVLIIIFLHSTRFVGFVTERFSISSS